MHSSKFKFSVLPKRLLVHMPEPKLLRQPSREMKQGQKAFHRKVAHATKRPFKQREAFWQSPTFTTPMKYSAAVGIGVVLTLAAQRFQHRRASAQP